MYPLAEHCAVLMDTSDPCSFCCCPLLTPDPINCFFFCHNTHYQPDARCIAVKRFRRNLSCTHCVSEETSRGQNLVHLMSAGLNNVSLLDPSTLF
jgi:hypothetical protein